VAPAFQRVQVSAIYLEEDLPEEWRDFARLNPEHFTELTLTADREAA
jgi:hypothetical protein